MKNKIYNGLVKISSLKQMVLDFFRREKNEQIITRYEKRILEYLMLTKNRMSFFYEMAYVLYRRKDKVLISSLVHLEILGFVESSRSECERYWKTKYTITDAGLRYIRSAQGKS